MNVSRTTRQALFACLLLASAAGVTKPLAAQGLQAGLAWSELTGVEGLEVRRGLVFGASFTLFRIGPVYVGPEILYIQKGARVATPGQSGVEDIRLDWFDIPLLFELGGYIAGTPIRPAVYAGPYYGLQSGCSFAFTDADDRSGDCLLTGLRDVGIDGVFADGHAGWIVGGSLELYTGDWGNIAIDARYTASFSDIMQTGSSTLPKTRSFVVMAGWLPTFR